MTMQYRRLSDADDYVFGQSGQDFYTGVDAVAQAIYTRLKLLYGEWWEDLKDGLPLFENILGSPGSPQNKKAIDALITERILGTLNVKGIADFSSSFDANTRAYSFTCTVNTAFGQVTIGN